MPGLREQDGRDPGSLGQIRAFIFLVFLNLPFQANLDQNSFKLTTVTPALSFCLTHIQRERAHAVSWLSVPLLSDTDAWNHLAFKNFIIGGVPAGPTAAQSNEVGQQISRNVCQLENGCCFPSASKSLM